MGIQLSTLGRLAIRQDGKERPELLPWRRRLGLLVYLAVEGRGTRERLFNLFWPEKEYDQALGALNQALLEIRQVCGAGCLMAEDEGVRASAEVEVDAVLFRSMAEAGDHAHALTLYGGAFLEGVHLVRTRAFERWVDRVRTRLRRLHRQAREARVAQLLEAGDLPGALEVARAWAELEPSDDQAQRRLGELLAMRASKRTAEPEADAGQARPPLRAKAETSDRDRRLQPRLEKPWIGEVVDILKDRWVFRIVLAYGSGVLLAIGIPDAYNLSSTWALRITAVSLAGFLFLPPLVWALEPTARRKMGYREPRPWRGIPGGRISRRVWALRGIIVLVSAGASLFVGAALWPPPPAPDSMAGESRSSSHSRSLAILPIASEDPNDDFLSSVGRHLTRTLIDHFRSYGVLDVPIMEAVEPYEGSGLPLDSIRDQLGGVDILMRGTLGQRGDSVILTLNFQGSEDVGGAQASYAVPFQQDLDEIQLARMVTDSINVQLREKLGQEIRTTALRLGTRVEEAFRLVREGLDERGLAVGLTRRGDFPGASRAIEQADSLFGLASVRDPRWPDPLFLRGSLSGTRVALGDLASSVPGAEDFRVSPENRDQVLQRGLDRVEAGLRLDPGNKDGYLARAGLLAYFRPDPRDSEARTKLFRDREDALRRAWRGDPPRPEAAYGLAQVYFEWGRYEQAEEYYQEAFRQDVFRQRLPDDLLKLGRIRLETGKEELGYRECAREKADRPWDRRMLAECQLLLLAFGSELAPDVSSAEALATDPEWQELGFGQENQNPPSDFLVLLAGVFARAQEQDTAQALLQEAMKMPSGIPVDYLAGVLARLGRRSEAVEVLRGEPGLHFQSRVFDPLRGFPPFDSLAAAAGGGG